MNRELVIAEWKKASGALRSARILTDAGEYDDAVTRAYYAMRHASLAALATRGVTPPRTHQGVQNAVRNQLVHDGELSADRLEDLGHGRQTRESADYDAFAWTNQEEAEGACRHAGQFLTETRRYLMNKGIEQERLPSIAETTGRKPVGPGGDPAVKPPGTRPNIQPPKPRGDEPQRGRE